MDAGMHERQKIQLLQVPLQQRMTLDAPAQRLAASAPGPGKHCWQSTAAPPRGCAKTGPSWCGRPCAWGLAGSPQSICAVSDCWDQRLHHGCDMVLPTVSCTFVVESTTMLRNAAAPSTGMPHLHECRSESLQTGRDTNDVNGLGEGARLSIDAVLHHV